MMIKIIIEILAIITIGWVAGAEITSWYGIQPLVSKLPYDQQIDLTQGMLKTIGKVMPALIPVSAVLVVILFVLSLHDPNLVIGLRVAACICIATAVLTTLTISVPINNTTAQWQITDSYETWMTMRTRWNFFLGLRGGLFMLSFILLTISAVVPKSH